MDREKNIFGFVLSLKMITICNILDMMLIFSFGV
jgi:hypothetical protein